MVSFADIEAAADRLSGIAHQTLVATSRTVDAATGASVFFKCENFQRAGAFKFRGAFNTLSHMHPAERRRGVLTFSSGNHAQALALAARELDVPATIIMPDDAPAVKLEATRGYGAEIITYRRADITREELASRISSERGLPIIPPYDHPDIVAGQGTAALELIKEVGELDLLLLPCGGGGLLSGSAIAIKFLLPRCQVVGVEPSAADDATRSFHSGELQSVRDPNTIADGARTPSLGKVTFPLVLKYVDEMTTVPDASIIAAMRFLWERMKLVVEPTGALALAALLDGRVDARGKRVGVMLSGGNVDVRMASEWME